MRIFKSHPLLKLVNAYLVDASQPSNISYLWNFGSLLAVCLVIQIVTGVTLAMHYSPSVLEAFNSIEHIMRDVNNGWLVRYLHSNTASAFFFLVYLHIGRGMYYGSYRSPRTLVWFIGTIILIVMMATAFLGYVLPYGQMSLWGATVITNLISAIPWIGQDIVEFLWGGFSVNNATLNRFFALHFVLPFILAALVLMHLIALHDVAGSSNPLGVSGNYDRVSFAPYYLFKDLITIFIFIFVSCAFVLFMPNVLGDSENYIMANPMQTPPAIVPEWYLLPFYAILRSIPNKLLGVIAMFSAILVIMLLPITDLGRSKGLQFRPLSLFAFFIFVGNFLVLMVLGACHVESPFIELGQVCTAIYFGFFTIVMPVLSLLEKTFMDISSYYTIKIFFDSKPKKVFGGYTGGGIGPTLLSSVDSLNTVIMPLVGGLAYLKDLNLNLNLLSCINNEYLYIVMLLCAIPIGIHACILKMENNTLAELVSKFEFFLRDLPQPSSQHGDEVSKALREAAHYNLITGNEIPYTGDFNGKKLTEASKQVILERCLVAKDAYNHNGKYLNYWNYCISPDGSRVNEGTGTVLTRGPAIARKELALIVYGHRHVAPSPPRDQIWEKSN